MLASIRIENFAIIDELDIEFESGLTVITGETGAGKSIVVDALSFLMGDRADSAVVREGADKADLTAQFLLPHPHAAMQWLQQNELDADGDCLLRRVISSEGRSRAFINGRPVTLQMLKELGNLLIDIHGQHEHQSLMKPSEQQALLDRFGGHQKECHAVAEAARTIKALQQEWKALKKEAEQRDAKRELLSYQVEELNQLELSEAGIKDLEKEHRRSANSTELQQGVSESLQLLYEGDEGSVYALLSQSQQQLAQLAKLDSSLQNAWQLSDTALTQVQELANELRHYQDRLELDPERMQLLDEQLSQLHSLARKHHIPMQQLPRLQQELTEELDNIHASDDRLEQLGAEVEKAKLAYEQAAARLSEKRAGAAKKLNKAITQQLQGLGMQGGVFEVKLQPRETQDCSADGKEKVEFLVSANPGQSLRPLAKVASGGELSRISLAIQVITAQQGVTPTMIFDEVDVGIGGGTAEIVGRMLRQLAQNAQLLCVTHQAQVAAQGHHHYQVAKNKTKNDTRTRMQPLSSAQRVDEIARMIGGVTITDNTRRHAEELLAVAG